VAVPVALSVAVARASANPSFFMDGVYDQTTLLNASSIEAKECAPATTEGIELPNPTPIHHIRGAPSGPSHSL
jgi:hypothetical protein